MPLEPATKRPRVDEDAAARTEKAKVHLASRGPVGATDTVGPILLKRGTRTERIYAGRREETYVLGAACSEVFSGPRLAKVLRPAVELQNRSLERLALGEACEPLSIHTSAGLPAPLGAFVEAVEAHLPWAADCSGWFMNLQLEGTTAVWAGVEALMHLQQLAPDGARRNLVAVAEKSYHGPKTTGLGQPSQPRWPGAPRTQGQLSYPLPSPTGTAEKDSQEFLRRFDAFLDEHAASIGVILFEPQWGSTYAARPWPKALLQEAIRRSHARGILVLCDEIMCGLGRHGQGTLFLSKAWGLEPDAVTFGKSVSAGPFPMSGAVVRRGGEALGAANSKVVQSHTYAGSSSLALLTAREVLDELPKWFEHAKRMGEVVKEVLGPCSDGQFLQVNGLGLMWGGLFTASDEKQRSRCLALLREACSEEGVWPYFVPAGGFMLTPPMDIEEPELREGLQRLVRSLRRVQQKLATA